MYIVIDTADMSVLYKHNSLEVLNNIIWIEQFDVNLLIVPVDDTYYLNSFSNDDLEKLGHHIEAKLNPNRDRVSLIIAVHDAIQRIPDSFISPLEVKEQAEVIPATDQNFYFYVQGHKLPMMISGRLDLPSLIAVWPQPVKEVITSEVPYVRYDYKNPHIVPISRNGKPMHLCPPYNTIYNDPLLDNLPESPEEIAKTVCNRYLDQTKKLAIGGNYKSLSLRTRLLSILTGPLALSHSLSLQVIEETIPITQFKRAIKKVRYTNEDGIEKVVILEQGEVIEFDNTKNVVIGDEEITIAGMNKTIPLNSTDAIILAKRKVQNEQNRTK